MHRFLIVWLCWSVAAWAEADGPDFYRVTGVTAEDHLNLRTDPSPNAAKIAEIPFDADGLRNLGCDGRLSYEDWSNATEEERAAAEKNVWCRVAFDGQEGWVAGRFLSEGNAPTSHPSFDCAKAEGEVETLICASPLLASLDREVARIYALAKTSGDAVLPAEQRGWIKGRDECWKATDAVETCVIGSYVERIDALRTGYAEARGDDAAGVSLGPLPYDCPGLDAGLSAVFVNVDPSQVSLRWSEFEVVLGQVRAASGVKYEGDYANGTYVFWTKGPEALFELPGRGSLNCTEDVRG